MFQNGIYTEAKPNFVQKWVSVALKLNSRTLQLQDYV